MEPKKSYNYLFIFLALLAFVADIATLFQLFNGGIILETWSLRWFLGIMAIIILLGFGIAMLKMSGSDKTGNVLSVFGIIYIIYAAILYLNTGYVTFTETVSFKDYLGFMVLILIIVMLAEWCLEQGANKKFHEYASYIFVTINLVFLLAVIFKYVGQDNEISMVSLFGECIAFGFGAYLFIHFYTRAHKDKASILSNLLSMGSKSAT